MECLFNFTLPLCSLWGGEVPQEGNVVIVINEVCFSYFQYLEKELGIEALKTMKRIKGALDPNNIMNPGKLIPPHICF